MNTPCQQAMQRALGFRTPVYAHMSVTVSEDGGKLSKRERPKAFRKVIKAQPNIDTAKLAAAAGLSVEELESFIAGKTAPDMPCIDAMAGYLGADLPEINVVDFFKSGYLPEALMNFIALLGFNPGGEREIMPVEDLVGCFDLSRLTKSNSLFDRQKLIAFNTEHIKILSEDRLVQHFKDYLTAIRSPVAGADDATLAKIIRANEGARTLAQMEQKSRFLFIGDDEVQYDAKAVKKILLKGDGLSVLRLLRDKLAAMTEFNEASIETMLRSMAEERQVGLGKVAQPLRVAICGTTISLPIFNSVQMLGREKTLSRIDITLNKFEANSRTKDD